MIVLDEQLEDPRIATAIERWYPGKVINIREARRNSEILDDAVPTILHRFKSPTFVTTNFRDFWRKIEAHSGYCVVCINLPINRSLEVPDILRDLLKLPEWSSKRKCMGKVIAISAGRVRYYR
jgi:hypothetical protein